MGLESGDAVTLKAIHKGAGPEEMIAAGRKAREAGFKLSSYSPPGDRGPGTVTRPRA